MKIGGNDPALRIIGRKGKHSGVIVIVMGMRNKDIQWFFFIEKGQCALIIVKEQIVMFLFDEKNRCDTDNVFSLSHLFL